MSISYPTSLPRGLHSGRTYSVVSPLLRSELANGRARQRRKFLSVPEYAEVSWLFNDLQGTTFEAWFRDALVDGSEWFDCPLDHPLGYATYRARFASIYGGPERIGPALWRYTATLEIEERIALPDGAGLFPDYILDASIFDIAINSYWPQA